MEQFIEKQLNEGYNAKLNKLFDKWIASYEADKRNLLCRDGLIIKHKNEDSGYDVNKKWHDVERKIMFIVKDCPDGWGYDARRLFVGYPDNKKSLQNAEETRNVKGVFFKNIAKLLYGLSQENKGTSNSHDDIDKNRAAQIKAFDEIPFAFVEAKKLAGGKACSKAELQKTLKRDGQFLAEEIGILQPNIIVCCDKDGIIFNSVVQNYFHGKIPSNDHRWEYDYFYEGYYCGFGCKLYYYEDEGVLLFNSNHPSSRIAKWIIYEKVLHPFRRFFERYKTFDRVSAITRE